MPETVFGLPVHPLIVHATVVMVPLTAVAVALWFLSPRFRNWSGILPLGMAAVSVVLAPLSTSSGESLEHMVGETKLVQEHAELGDMLVWWCVGMLVVAAAGWFLGRRSDLGRGVTVALTVAGVIVAGGTLVQTVLIGHSGAKAAWSKVAQSSQGSSSADGDD